MDYKDLAGNEIRSGDFVAYAALWSRSPILKFGVVTRLEQRKPSYYQKDSTPTLRVITVDRSTRWNRETNESKYFWELQNKGKEITLGFLDRMLVVPKEQVPREAFEILVVEHIKWEKENEKK